MMTKIYLGVNLAAVAVIAVALGVGPAHAGGLRTATVELLPIEGLPCAESFGDTCNANANASAVTAKSFGRDPAKYTLFTAIAEDLWPYKTLYGLYSLRSTRTIEQLISEGCEPDERIGTFETNDGGDLPEPTTIGTVEVIDTNVVYVCREAGPYLILLGSLTGGASSGGKNRNRRN